MKIKTFLQWLSRQYTESNLFARVLFLIALCCILPFVFGLDDIDLKASAAIEGSIYEGHLEAMGENDWLCYPKASGELVPDEYYIASSASFSITDFSNGGSNSVNMTTAFFKANGEYMQDSGGYDKYTTGSASYVTPGSIPSCTSTYTNLTHGHSGSSIMLPIEPLYYICHRINDEGASFDYSSYFYRDPDWGSCYEDHFGEGFYWNGQGVVSDSSAPEDPSSYILNVGQLIDPDFPQESEFEIVEMENYNSGFSFESFPWNEATGFYDDTFYLDSVDFYRGTERNFYSDSIPKSCVNTYTFEDLPENYYFDSFWIESVGSKFWTFEQDTNQAGDQYERNYFLFAENTNPEYGTLSWFEWSDNIYTFDDILWEQSTACGVDGEGNPSETCYQDYRINSEYVRMNDVVLYTMDENCVSPADQSLKTGGYPEQMITFSNTNLHIKIVRNEPILNEETGLYEDNFINESSQVTPLVSTFSSDNFFDCDFFSSTLEGEINQEQDVGFFESFYLEAKEFMGNFFVDGSCIIMKKTIDKSYDFIQTGFFELFDFLHISDALEGLFPNQGTKIYWNREKSWLYAEYYYYPSYLPMWSDKLLLAFNFIYLYWAFSRFLKK